MTKVSYTTFNLKSFLLMSGLLLAIGIAICVLDVIEANNKTGEEFGLNRKMLLRVISIIPIPFLLIEIVLMATVNKTVYTEANTVYSITKSAEYYVVNGNINVSVSDVYHDEEIAKSYVALKKEEISYICGIKRHTSYYELLLNDADYKKFYSQEIKYALTNNSKLYRFILGLCKEAGQVEENKENEGARGIAGTEVVEKKEGVERTEQLEKITIELNDEALDKLEFMQSRIDSLESEVHRQKLEIDELKNKNKIGEMKDTILVIVGSLVVLWIMGIISFVVYSGIKTSSKRKLIITASDAKIREGVMLDDSTK